MFDIILFFTRWKDGILPSRDEVLRDSFMFWYPHKNSKANYITSYETKKF